MSIADILLSILWLALFVYAIFGGADFGAGMLELFAVGESGRRQEALIDESVRDPGRFFRANVTGGLNLLDAMTANGVSRMVFSSTAARPACSWPLSFIPTAKGLLHWLRAMPQ